LADVAITVACWRIFSRPSEFSQTRPLSDVLPEAAGKTRKYWFEEVVKTR